MIRAERILDFWKLIQGGEKMLIKICPLCDSEMKKAHYCDTCHSFVWKPQVLDVHYNTESRGKGEIDCAYGEVHDAHDHQMPDMKKWHKQFGMNENPQPRTTAAPKEKKKTPGVGKVIAIIIVVITLIDMLGSFIVGVIGSHVDEIPIEGIENVIELFDETDEVMDDETPDDLVEIESEIQDQIDQGNEEDTIGDMTFEVISDEELAAFADGCPEYAHFDRTVYDVRAEFDQWFQNYAQGQGIAAEDIHYNEYAYNYRYTLDGEEHIMLNTYLYADFEASVLRYIELNYDSASMKIHSLTLSDIPAEDAKAFVEFAVPVLTGETPEWQQEAFGILFNGEGYGYYEAEGVEIDCYELEEETEDGDPLYSVQIYPYPDD